MAIARHVTVTGRVQGVFFRAWTKEQADALSVCGWVRNTSDGAVEAHVQGDDIAVEQMIERMRSGPPSARVEDLSIRNVETRDFDGFDVRH